MVDISTKYMGLQLRNPLIIGSSELTSTVDGIKRLEESGAAAVVLKSLFEEEIMLEMQGSLQRMASESFIYPETLEYYEQEMAEDSTSRYLNLINETKRVVKIPVIASINCVSAGEWMYFPKQVEDAGADALEINAFIPPTDFSRNAADNEKAYFDIVQEVCSRVNIPVSLKLTHYFSDLGPMLQRFSTTGISGMVLFNRFYSPDIDINSLEVVPASIFSAADDIASSLRWIAIMSQRVDCDLAASSGVHTGKSLIKQLLVGANAVQVVSTIYKNGRTQINTILAELTAWMQEHNYNSINDFRGKLSQSNSDNPAVYERMQFIENFTRYK